MCWDNGVKKKKIFKKGYLSLFIKIIAHSNASINGTAIIACSLPLGESVKQAPIMSTIT